MVVLPGVILIVSAVQRDWRPAVLSAAVMAVAVLFIGAHFSNREVKRLEEQRRVHRDAPEATA
jgi:hypothetical protein